MRTRTTTIAVVLAATLLAACGGDDDEDDGATGTTEAPEATEASVTIERSRFEPDELVVPAGAEVTWTNDDPFAHTVTAADDSSLAFDSGEMAEGDTFAQVFDEAGTYEYFCEIHPTMRSTVVVE